MNCKKTRHAIGSGEMTPEVIAHLAACDSCRLLNEKVNRTLSLLDQEVTVPETLTSAILARREQVTPQKISRMKLVTYIQVAAAVIFGVFIGHQFGRNAGPVQKTASVDPVHQYFKAHHFNLDHSDYKSPSFFNLNNND